MKSRTARSFEQREQLFRAVLNFVAGLFHILAKAMGRIASRAGDGQKCGDEQKNNDSFGYCDHIFAFGLQFGACVKKPGELLRAIPWISFRGLCPPLDSLRWRHLRRAFPSRAAALSCPVA